MLYIYLTFFSLLATASQEIRPIRDAGYFFALQRVTSSQVFRRLKVEFPVLDDMKDKMRRGEAEFPHNWIFLRTFEENRKFTIAGYGYHDHLKENRDAFMGDILYDKNMKDAKGKLVIGMNVDKTHYPYSVLGCWLSSDLFDNRYLKMLRKNDDGED